MSRTIAALRKAGKRARAAGAAVLAVTVLALGTVVAPAPVAAAPLSPQDVQIYRDAFRAADNERFDEAMRIADRAKDRLGAKVVRWLALANEGTASFEEIAAFIQENADWPYMAQLRRQAERAMPADLDETRVLAWFKKYPPTGIDGVMHYANTLLATGGTATAVQMLRERWADGTFTAAEEDLFLASYRSHLRQQDHLTRFQRLLWDRQEAAARRLLPFLGEGYEALLEARFALDGDPRSGEAAAARVPTSLRNDAGLLYDRARALRKRGDDEGAIAILLKPPADLGRDAAWWSERHILIRRAIERGDHRLAYRLASTQRQEDAGSHADAEFLSGWLALRFLDRPSDAFAHFHRLYRAVTAPISRARGAYWCGRAAEALGNRAQAREWFQTAAAYGTTFYGQLATHQLGQGARLALPAEPRVTNAEATAFERRETVRVARLLAQVLGPDGDRQAAFLRRLSLDAKSPGEYALAARLARETGRPDLAIAAAKDAAQNGIFLVDSGYPTVSVPGASPEPSLVHAIIRQESTFNTNIVSSAGARGLMQLMPTTAQLVAKQLGIRHTHSRLTSDPEYNIRLGSTYMADLIDRFNGSYVLAIASYNAGPGRARAWIDQFGDPRSEGIDVVDWIELIPLSETRNYVQRVMEALLVYRAKRHGSQAELDLYKELRR